MTKDEQRQVLGDIVGYLREVQRFTEQDLLNKHQGEPRIVRMLIWQAREQVRIEDGVDFGPVRGWPGTFERKEWDQIEKRAQRQRSRGTRAHKRAEERLRLAASLAPTEDQRRMNDAADRIALRLAMRASKGVGGPR